MNNLFSLTFSLLYFYLLIFFFTSTRINSHASRFCLYLLLSPFSISSVPTCCAPSTPFLLSSFTPLSCGEMLPCLPPTSPPPFLRSHHPSSTHSVIRARWRQRWCDAGREDWVWSQQCLRNVGSCQPCKERRILEQ